MKSKQLKEILEQHKLWLDSVEEKGRRANLKDANLRGADLRDANLEFADLMCANLSGADLRDANLRCANLRGANLRGSNLESADLRSVNLASSDLEGAKLSGVNLYDAGGVLQWQSPQGVKRICYSVKHDICVMHKLGCFWGNTEEAVDAIRKKYGDNSLYERFLLMQVEALEKE